MKTPIMTEYRLNRLKNHLIKNDAFLPRIFGNEANNLRIMAFYDFTFYLRHQGFEVGQRAYDRAMNIMIFANFLDPMGRVTLWTLYEFVFGEDDIIEPYFFDDEAIEDFENLETRYG